MSYLHINGYAIPIESCEPTHQHIAASMGYSPNGVYQLSRNGYARAWKCRSGLLTTAERHAMMAILGHRGDGWRFNLSAASNGVVYITDATSPEVYSDKFKVPQSAEAVATIMAAYGADGARVYDWNGNPYGAFDGSQGSVLVEPGTTNLLSANEAHPTANGHVINVFTGTHAADSARYWTGSGCIAVNCLATNDGIEVNGTGVVSSDYVLTGKVRGHVGGEQLQVLYLNNAGTTIANGNITLAADADRWTRVRVYGTQVVDTNVRLRILSNNGAMNFSVDGLQIEQKTTQPTAWVDPGQDPWGSGSGVRPNGVLDFDTFVSEWVDGFTLSAWVNVQNVTPAASGLIVDTGSGNPRTGLYITTGGALVFFANASGPATSALSVTGGVVSAGWHHVVGVYDRDANTAYLYVDGAADGSDDTWSGVRQYFDIENSANDTSIGSAGTAGANTFPGPIASVQFLPYAMPATVIAGMYDSAQQVRLPPGVLPLSVHGDALQLGERWIQATATLDATPHNPWWNGATFESGGGRVAFTLNEAVRRSA